MGKGKHASNDGIDLSGIPFKQIIIGILLVAVLFGIGFGGFNLIKSLSNRKDKNQEKPKDIEETLGMIKSLEGYDVLGKIVVDDLEIETYILNSIEEKALKAGAGKINGKTLNEEGNFAIIGHNYDNIFAKLLEIEKGKVITVIDPKMEETDYEVVDVYAVEPDNLEPLLDVTGKTRITLITCENTASTRLVVVAEKIEDTKVENDKVENTVE